MSAEPRFILYSFWRSSATYRVRVALNLKEMRATERYVDLDHGDQISDAFLKINPLGAIPALIDREAGPHGIPLTQSLPILEFLEEIQPQPALLPVDAQGRARVRSLASMLTADTHPMITPRVRKYLTDEGKFDAAAWRAWQTHWFTTGLRAVEQRLASEPATGQYCHGDSISIADICLSSILVVMRVFKIEVEGVPTVNRIATLCETLEAFAKAEPARQEGAPPS
jgi:maleylacetoacetate isomerase